MGEKKKKSPFLTDKPSSVPKRDKSNDPLLRLNEKMKNNINKLKNSR